jgi:hypothetical protein
VFSSLQYGRRLDDITSATVTVGAPGLSDEACCECLSMFNPWQHEVVIFRDGALVWAGPITEPVFERNKVTIVARDLFEWFERRVLRRDHTGTKDLATFFSEYAQDALDQDNSMNITISPSPTGIVGTREVLAALYRRAADELRELARTGLDFTAVGRNIRCGGEEVPTPPLIALTEDIFDEAKLTLAGLSMGTDMIVLGGNGSATNTPFAAEVGGLDDRLGLVTLTFNEPGILDNQSALAAARTRHDMFKYPPPYLTGRILGRAPIRFGDLIPGVRMDWNGDIGCRDTSGSFRLLAIDVTVDASTGGVTERIVPTLVPLGTEGDTPS